MKTVKQILCKINKQIKFYDKEIELARTLYHIEGSTLRDIERYQDRRYALIVLKEFINE